LTYVSDSSAEKANALVAQIEGMGVKAKAVKSNAGVFAECETLVNDTIKEFGAIDVCINNAGIPKDNLLLCMSEEQWD
ncbi:SDR family NAD(P)-dependent oxidoreductase, partial [Escherichia coli]|uniref:SDR family NAD(P)-dependent oxidoreductase n=1 Tax=Escherichia coli TaxID=562 RepID=UPI003CE47643